MKTPAAPRGPVFTRPGRRNRDVLGLCWLHGALHAVVFRRHQAGLTWAAPQPVRTPAEFEVALDQALAAVKFAGAEVFLVLAHGEFVHQFELAPAFSEGAARNYLRGRVQRYEQEKGPVLWVSQRTATPRQETAFLLHMLPVTFYTALNGLLRDRRLDLTRILPLSVPLQLLLDKAGPAAKQPVLVAAPAGAATALLIGQAGKPLFFSRNLLIAWDADPARVAVEVNRSLFYAKQQFGIAVQRLWLLGRDLDPAAAELKACCGADKEITTEPAGPLDWLQTVARLSLGHPVNLVAGYISRKRRLQFIRRVVMAACWLALILAGLESWSRSLNWAEERERLDGLQANQATLFAERARLQERNATADERRRFIHAVNDTRLAPFPAKLLAFIGGSLPVEVSLTDYVVKWDETTAGWTFRVEGLVQADAETAQELLTDWQQGLARGPLRVSFNDNLRTLLPVPVAGGGLPVSQRFSIEGGYREN